MHWGESRRVPPSCTGRDGDWGLGAVLYRTPWLDAAPKLCSSRSSPEASGWLKAELGHQRYFCVRVG